MRYIGFQIMPDGSVIYFFGEIDDGRWDESKYIIRE